MKINYFRRSTSSEQIQLWHKEINEHYIKSKELGQFPVAVMKMGRTKLFILADVCWIQEDETLMMKPGQLVRTLKKNHKGITLLAWANLDLLVLDRKNWNIWKKEI
jgi:hypothetical protein